MKLRLPLTLLSAVLYCYHSEGHSAEETFWTWQGDADGTFAEASGWQDKNHWNYADGVVPADIEMGPNWRSSGNWGSTVRFNKEGSLSFENLDLEGWDFKIAVLNGARINLKGTIQKLQGPNTGIDIGENSKLVWDMNMPGNGVDSVFNMSVLPYEGLVFKQGWKRYGGAANISLGTLGSIHSDASQSGGNMTYTFHNTTLLRYGEEGFKSNAGQYSVNDVSMDGDSNYIVYSRRLWSVADRVSLGGTFGTENFFNLTDGDIALTASSTALTASESSLNKFYLYRGTDGGFYVDYATTIGNEVSEMVVTWVGGTASWNSTVTNWSDYTGAEVSFSDGKIALFDAGHEGTVTIDGVLSPALMKVTGGEYTFVSADADSMINLAGGLYISGSDDAPTQVTFSSANKITGSVSVTNAILTLGNNAALPLGNLSLNQGTLNLNAAGFGGFTVKEGMSGTIQLGDGATMGILTLTGGNILGGGSSQGSVSTINVNASAGNDGVMELSGTWKSTGNLNMTRGMLTISGDDTRIVLDGAFLVGENVSAVNTILMKGGELVVKGSGTHSSTDFSMQLSNWARTSFFTLEKGCIFLKRQLTVTQAGTGSFIMKNGFLGTEGINMYRNTSEATSSTFTMDGGTTILGGIGLRMSGTGTTTSPLYVNLNQGTLGASADWTLSVPAILGGSVTFDTTGYTIDDDTLAYTKGSEGKKITISGNLSGVGKIATEGAGSLVLTGTNTHSGGTVVKSGILSISSMDALGTGISTISRGATLKAEDSFADAALTLAGGKGIGVGAGTSGSANLTMGLNINEGGVFTVDCGALVGLAGTDTPLLAVTGTLTSSGSSQFSLVNFDGSGVTDLSGEYILATGTFGTWSDSALASAYLDVEISPYYSYAVSKSDGKLVLNVTSKEGILYWNKADSGVWKDGGEAIWVNQGGTASTYNPGNSVIFRDLTVGDTGTTLTVDLEGTLSPGYIEFSNSKDHYVLTHGSASGALSGTFGIVKKGSASVTLATDNSGMSGTIDLKEGSLVAGHVNALGTGTLKFNGGSLVLGVDNVAVSTIEGVDVKIVVDGNNSFSWAPGNASLADRNLIKSGDGSLVLNETAYSGKLTSTGDGTIILNTNAATTISNTVVLSGNIAKTGSGSLTIDSGAFSNSQNLNFDVREGELVLKGNVSSGSFNINLSGPGATLKLGDAGESIGNVNGKLTMGAGSRLILWNGNYWGTTFGMGIQLNTGTDGIANIDGTVSGGTTVGKAISGQGNLQVNNMSGWSNILTLPLNNTYVGNTYIGTSEGGGDATNLTYSGAVPGSGILTPWGTGDVTIGIDRTVADWETADTSPTPVTLSATTTETTVYRINNNVTLRAFGGKASLKMMGNGIATLGGMISITTDGTNTTEITAGNALKMEGGLSGGGVLDITLKAPAEGSAMTSQLELTGDNTAFTGSLNVNNAHVTLGSASRNFGGSLTTGGGNLYISSGGQVISGDLALGTGGLIVDSTALASGFAALTVSGNLTADPGTFSLTIDNSDGKLIPDVDGKYVILSNAGNNLSTDSISWKTQLAPDIARFYSFQNIDGKLYLSIMGLTSVVWVGDEITGNGTWSNGTTGWMDGSIEYVNNKAVTFTDMESSHSVITIGSEGKLVVNPASIAVSSDGTDYTWQGAGAIGDHPDHVTTLRKSGSSTLTINQGQANTFSGGTTLEGGAIVLQSVGGLGTGGVALHDGNLVLDRAGEILTSGNKLAFQGGTLVYSAGSAQDTSSLIDLDMSTDAVRVHVLQNGTSPHSVSWSAAWNAIGRDLILNNGLEEGQSAGQLNIAVTGSLSSGLTIGAGTLKISVDGAGTLSGAVSGSGTLMLESRNTGSSRSTVFAGDYSGFSGKLVLIGQDPLTRNNRYQFSNTSLFDHVSGIEVDGSNLYVEGSGEIVIGADMLIQPGGVAFDGNSGQSYKLTGSLSGTGSVFFAADGGINQLALAGDISRFNGSIASGTGCMILLGDGHDAALTEDGFLTRAASLYGDGAFVLDYSNDASLGSIVSGTAALRQAGNGVLTLTGACTSSGTLTVDTRAVLADGASWAGAMTGNGELTVLNSQSLDLSQISGGLNLVHGGSGVLSIHTASPGDYTGHVSVSGGGTLDLGDQAYSNAITMVHGILANAGHATNLHIDATGHVDMGGIDGSMIKSLTSSAGIISNINGNISLGSAAIGIGKENMDSISHSGIAAVEFNQTDSTLTLDRLTLDVVSIESFLKDHRDEYKVLVTNGTLAGAVAEDTDNIAFTPYLADLGYDLLEVSGGYVSIDGRTVDTPFSVLSDEEKTIKNPISLERYPSLFVNGKLHIRIKPDQEIVFKKLQSDSWATEAWIDLGADSSITVVLSNDGLDTSYAGSITGSGSIVKTGGNSLAIGGNVSANGGAVDIREGKLSIGGLFSTDELTVASSMAGKPVSLSIGGAASVTGTTEVGRDASLVLGGNLDSGSLRLTGNGKISLHQADIILHDEAGSNVIGSGTSISGSGSLILANGSSLTVSGGSSIDAGIIFELGRNWTLRADSDISISGLDGDNTLSISNESVVTLAGDKDAEFTGTLDADSLGSIVKTGGSRQILRVSAKGLSLDTRNGVMEINRKNVTESMPAFDRLSVGPLDDGHAELLLRTDTKATGLVVRNHGVLTLGDADADRQYAPVSLFVDGNAVFEEGSSLSTIVPNEKGGVAATGTITLPNSMTVNLVNNGSGSIATADDLVVMMAGEGLINAGGEALLAGTGFSDWKVTLEKSISLFYSSANIHVGADGKSLMATPVFNKVNTLEQYAKSDTALAGANMLWFAGIQAGGSNLDNLLSSIMDDIKGGNGTSASRSMAASAGSTVTSMNAAQIADFRYQQMLIRNRMTTMGLNPDYNYEGELPLFNAWIQGNGSYNTLNGDGDFAGYQLNTWGGTAGVDVSVSGELTFGAAFTASYGDLDSTGADSLTGNLDSFYVNLFARYQHKNWGHNFMATCGQNDISVTRSVRFGADSYEGSGDTNGSSWGAMYEVTYDIALDENHSSLLQPLVNVSVAHAGIDAYEESGAGNAGLKVGDMKWTTATIAVGSRLLGLIGSNVFGRETLGELRVQVAQDIGDDRGESDVSFLGNPGYGRTVKGADIGKTGLQVGAGLSLPTGTNGTIFVEANADIRSGATSANGSLGYRYNF